MYILRLQKEWHTVTRIQYKIDLNIDGTVKETAVDSENVDSDLCIKLLTRCIKMYEAKQLILKLLKMSMEKDRLMLILRNNENINESEASNLVGIVRRLGDRIT